jgi:hypothetical protein
LNTLLGGGRAGRGRLVLYKFVGAKTGAEARDLLKFYCEARTLRANGPTTFNDPFEFKVAFDFDAEEEVIRRRYVEDNPDNVEADYVKWREGFTWNFKWWLAQETRRKLMAPFGVICFTTIEDNHLLWSHYAAQHKGFCVGLDESITQSMTGVQRCGPVKYQREAPKFRYYYDSPDTFAEKVFAYKSDRWAYESEYRIVLDRQGDVAFPERGLREVILGCRAYSELREYADNHPTSLDITFFQMVEDFADYSLKKVSIERGVRMMSSFF